MTIGVDEGFERSARPLLDLVQRLTGLETSFVTHIDWEAQVQEVVVALNSGELAVPEGALVDWRHSMCRLTFERGIEHSADVPRHFPGSTGSVQLGLQSFFAVPILVGDATIGTVCGASRRSVELAPEVLVQLRLIARALAFQLASVAEARALRARAEAAEALAQTDSLTGLPNRRAFTTRLEEEMARSVRHGTPLALILIDVDRFKAVNDTHGHDGGDLVLRTLADVLRQSARVEDVPARLGGDEFALLLPGVMADGADAAAGRLAETFQAAAAGVGIPSTLSIGVSDSVVSNLSGLVASADAALYRSKSGGRDRVEVASGVNT